MIQPAAQIGALHQILIALTVKFENVSRVRPQDRLSMVQEAEGFWRITIHYGFIEVPDLPAVLREARARGCPIDPDNAMYFGGCATTWSAPGRRRPALVVAVAAVSFPIPQLATGSRAIQYSKPQFLELVRQIEI